MSATGESKLSDYLEPSVAEVQARMEDAVRHTAKALGIEDADWHVAQDLLKPIEDANSTVYGSLKKFLEAYSRYADTLRKIGPGGAVGGPVERELIAAIQQRDAARHEWHDAVLAAKK